MHSIRNALFLVSYLLIFTVIGCSSPDVKPTNVVIDSRENLKTDPGQARQVDPAAKVVSSANKIKVLDIRTTTVNGRMQITVLLKNDRGLRDVINVRMRWLDGAGIMAAQYDPWETVALEGFEEKTITLNSPTPRAEDFRLEMQSND